MDDHMREDINSQPENLKKVITHLYGPERKQLEDAANVLRRGKPIIFIGMASAAYLCLPTHYYLGKNGFVVETLYASDAFHNLLPMLKQSSVVINSRSGETVEIVQLARALTEAGLPFTAITNEPHSFLGSSASNAIFANSRKDELVSINIVTSMMLTTLLLGTHITGEADKLRSQIQQLPTLMEEVIDAAWKSGDDIADFLLNTRPIYFLYRGASVGSSYCSRLVLEEVARTPSVSLEAGEFRQGPIEIVNESFGAVLFVNEGRQADLNLSLGEDLLNIGGRILFIGKNLTKMINVKALSFHLPDIPDFLLPILEVIPSQVLAYKLAEKQGYKPGEVKYISKVIVTEQGIPREGTK